MVEEHYDESAEREWERLLSHRTEFAVTMKALDEHLVPPPAEIVDIGGGPGRYAISLAKKGYGVTLVDLSQKSLDLARKKAEEAGVRLAGFVHQDATELSTIANGRFDAALLLGPLYHLLEEEQRRASVLEAGRIIRAGGCIFAAFITRFAPFRHAASNEPDWIFENSAYATELLETGKHVKGRGLRSGVAPMASRRSAPRAARICGCTISGSSRGCWRGSRDTRNHQGPGRARPGRADHARRPGVGRTLHENRARGCSQCSCCWVLSGDEPAKPKTYT